MAGYIITFRFKDTETSDTRRQNFYDFVKDNNIEIAEQTTSTIICKTNLPLCSNTNDGFIDKLLEENKNRRNDDKILIIEDNILFINIDKNNIKEIYRVKELKKYNPNQIKQIFAS